MSLGQDGPRTDVLKSIDHDRIISRVSLLVGQAGPWEVDTRNSEERTTAESKSDTTGEGYEPTAGRESAFFLIMLRPEGQREYG